MGPATGSACTELMVIEITIIKGQVYVAVITVAAL
jgi:hypothetical protein